MGGGYNGKDPTVHLNKQDCQKRSNRLNVRKDQPSIFSKNEKFEWSLPAPIQFPKSSQKPFLRTCKISITKKLGRHKIRNPQININELKQLKWLILQ